MVKDGSLIVRHRSCAQASVTRARGFPRVAHTSAHRVAPTSPFMSATVKKPGRPMDRTRWQKRCCTCSWGAYMKGNVCATRDPRGLDLRPGTHIMTGTENGGRSGYAALCYPLLVRRAKSRGPHTAEVRATLAPSRRRDTWLPDSALASGVQHCGSGRLVGCILLWLRMPKWESWLMNNREQKWKSRRT